MFYLTYTSECKAGVGYASLTGINGGSGSYNYLLTRSSDGATVDSGAITTAGLPLDFDGLYDASYVLLLTDAANSSNRGTANFHLACGYPQPGGGSNPAGLVLDAASATPETAAGTDGTATVQASGGAAPLTASLVELSLSKPATAGQPTTFTGLPAGTFTLRVTDSTSPTAAYVQQQVTVAAYVAPVVGCQDQYADNFNPAATSGGVDTCTYTPRWRSVWGPAAVAVRVAAVAGQVPAYIEADLRAGFRPGHPLAAARPLVAVGTLRATVGPDGYASFVLGPYLRPLLGAPDGAGGYRLDLNSPTAYTSDLFVGYELRRTGSGELLEHGYVLNAAVPDDELGVVLSPFAGRPPIWPGFAHYSLCRRFASSAGRYGLLEVLEVSDVDTVSLPCPPNPLLVAWLAPGGGFGLWVFQGRPVLADVVGEGQLYREAATGESRYSERGEARRIYSATSGPFRGAALAEGLATLARSPQVWLRPAADGPWVPVTIAAGTFPVERWGLLRHEVPITFTRAAAHYVQGQ